MKVRTNVKAGGKSMNHNETAARPGVVVKTAVKAGGREMNHNETLRRA